LKSNGSTGRKGGNEGENNTTTGSGGGAVLVKSKGSWGLVRGIRWGREACDCGPVPTGRNDVQRLCGAAQGEVPKEEQVELLNKINKIFSLFVRSNS